MRIGAAAVDIAPPSAPPSTATADARTFPSACTTRSTPAPYANDYPGYSCRSEAYAEGGYEAGTTPFAPEADRLLVDAALEALGRVR